MLKELIIQINNEYVSLNSELNIPITQTNIPIEYLKFRTHEDIYWKVELLEYIPDLKCWKMKVVDYFVSDTKNFSRQKSTKEIEKLAFERFDWSQLEQQLISYQKFKLYDVIFNQDADIVLSDEPVIQKIVKASETILPKLKYDFEPLQAEPEIISDSTTHQEPVEYSFEVKFSVNFSNAKFSHGHISFSNYLKEISKEIWFKIDNEYILEEFDTIKSWFARKLGRQKFKVFATITITGREIAEVIAVSPQIDKINKELIESIKYHRTISLLKPPKNSISDKSLFTSEEMFSKQGAENNEGNPFNQTENDILNYLVEYKEPRNRKQLEYLSGNKQSERAKLKFTLHPHFGFLFFIEGKKYNHFVWELLNSHATYIWSIEQSKFEEELQHKSIEVAINEIRDKGRRQYKRDYQNDYHNSDLLFLMIKHDDIDTNTESGFVNWKHKLEEIII